MWILQYFSIFLLISVINLVNCSYNQNVPNISSEDGQLIFAHILFRHGDRNPIDPYPNDPWKGRENWPEGFGQLTNIGKQQHYELGNYYSKRYQKLLGDGIYSTDKIYIQSTDVDRTLMSAEANLAGLFPPGDKQMWNDKLLWQPIPIHTIPEHSDYILAAKKPCARYEYAMKKYEESPEIKALFKKFKPLFKYIEENSGKTIRTFNDVLEVYNTLWIENLKNKTLPEWTNKVFVPGGEMEWVANFAFQFDTNTPEMAKLKTGFFLRDILKRFTDKINSKLSPDRSIWIYSAHDITIANVLNSLGLFTYPHAPPYASSVLFELYNQNGKYYIQIFYKNTTDETIPPLYIPSCGLKCPLDKFQSIYATIIPLKEFEFECRLSLLSMTYEEANLNPYETGYIVILCFAVACSLIVLTVWRYSHRERNQKRYLKL